MLPAEPVSRRPCVRLSWWSI